MADNVSRILSAFLGVVEAHVVLNLLIVVLT